MRLGHHGREQVGDIVVALELQHLGIDQDQAAFARGEAIEQRKQDAVQPHRLARAGGAGHQQVRHGGKVGHDRLARDVLAQDDRQAALVRGIGFGRGTLLQRYGLPVGIGQLDAHHRLARNGGDARADRAHVAGDILRQPDHPAGLHPRRGLQLVHGDHRAGAYGGDLSLDVEIVEHVFQQAGIALQRQLVELGRGGRRRVGQQVEAGQLIFVEQVLLARGAGELRRLGRPGGIGDLGRAPGGIFGGGRRAGLGLRLLALRHEGQRRAAGQCGRALEQVGQSEQLRPVDREDAAHQHRPARQAGQREGKDGPALLGFGQAPGQRLNRALAQQAGDAAQRRRKTAAGRGEAQR